MSHDPLGILSLSSGTVGTLMRQSERFLLYQCSDGWWINKVQFHLWWFNRHCGEWTRWQDCWRDYLALYDRFHASWKVSYQGEVEYEWKGNRYRRQCWFDPTYPHWNGQSVIDGGLARVGCVWCNFKMSDGYPPDDVIAACIGYAPLTATYDKRPNPGSILGYDIVNWQYVYHPDFGKPETADPLRPLPGHVYAKAWMDYDRIENWEDEPACKRLRRRLAS